MEAIVAYCCKFCHALHTLSLSVSFSSPCSMGLFVTLSIKLHSLSSVIMFLEISRRQHIAFLQVLFLSFSLFFFPLTLSLIVSVSFCFFLFLFFFLSFSLSPLSGCSVYYLPRFSPQSSTICVSAITRVETQTRWVPCLGLVPAREAGPRPMTNCLSHLMMLTTSTYTIQRPYLHIWAAVLPLPVIGHAYCHVFSRVFVIATKTSQCLPKCVAIVTKPVAIATKLVAVVIKAFAMVTKTVTTVIKLSPWLPKLSPWSQGFVGTIVQYVKVNCFIIYKCV